MSQKGTSQTKYHFFNEESGSFINSGNRLFVPDLMSAVNNHYLPQISEVTMSEGGKKLLSHKMLKEKDTFHDDV